MADIGHNSIGMQQAAIEKLRSLAANIVDCEDRAAEVAEEKRAFFKEAKSAGYDSSALRQAIAFLKDEAGRTEQEQIRDLYIEALRERG